MPLFEVLGIPEKSNSILSIQHIRKDQKGRSSCIVFLCTLDYHPFPGSIGYKLL
jgi:hypothetical protein